jgi:hypothetical protein
MDATTAQSLLATIANGIRLTFDAHIKIVALEKTLQERQPEIYKAYLETLEDVKRKPPFEFDLGALAMLQEKLVQS